MILAALLIAAAAPAAVATPAASPVPLHQPTARERAKAVRDLRARYCRPQNWGQSIEVRQFDATSPSMVLRIAC